MSGGVVLALFNVGRMHPPRFECWFNPSGFYPVIGDNEGNGKCCHSDKKARDRVDHGQRTMVWVVGHLRLVILEKGFTKTTKTEAMPIPPISEMSVGFILVSD